MEAQLSDMSEWVTSRSSKPNCPVSAAVPQTGGTSLTVSFRYDPFGRRIQKTSASGVTNYLYDGANIVAEVSSSGGVVASYAQGSGIDEPLAIQRGGSTVYYHADGLGSVTSLTNTSATTVATYVYDSFGKTTATGSIINPFRYTGRENDSERGLYYYRARYYDPTIGRFLSEDPVRYWGGIDFYKYVDNSPTNAKDPSGEIPVYGWWCGPNWTGGKFEPYDPNHKGSYKPPIDATDEVCMHHDICYYKCRKDNPCDKGARTSCMRNCDSVLIANMPNNWVGPLIGFGIDIGNDPPDADANDASCSCKK